MFVLSLSCSAAWSPTPDSQFLSCQTLDGRIVVRSHARVSSLTLKEIQYTDAGEYVCTASNTIGQDSQAMYLEVQCKWEREGCVWMGSGGQKGMMSSDEVEAPTSREICIIVIVVIISRGHGKQLSEIMLLELCFAVCTCANGCTSRLQLRCCLQHLREDYGP